MRTHGARRSSAPRGAESLRGEVRTSIDPRIAGQNRVLGEFILSRLKGNPGLLTFSNKLSILI